MTSADILISPMRRQDEYQNWGGSYEDFFVEKVHPPFKTGRVAGGGSVFSTQSLPHAEGERRKADQTPNTKPPCRLFNFSTYRYLGLHNHGISGRVDAHPTPNICRQSSERSTHAKKDGIRQSPTESKAWDVTCTSGISRTCPYYSNPPVFGMCSKLFFKS